MQVFSVYAAGDDTHLLTLVYEAMYVEASTPSLGNSLNTRLVPINGVSFDERRG